MSTKQHIPTVSQHLKLPESLDSKEIPSHSATMSEVFQMTHHSESDPLNMSTDGSHSASQSKNVGDYSHSTIPSHPTQQSSGYLETHDKMEIGRTNSMSGVETLDQSAISESTDEKLDIRNPVEEKR